MAEDPAITSGVDTYQLGQFVTRGCDQATAR
jgi:hypothetical protein